MQGGGVTLPDGQRYGGGGGTQKVCPIMEVLKAAKARETALKDERRVQPVGTAGAKTSTPTVERTAQWRDVRWRYLSAGLGDKSAKARLKKLKDEQAKEKQSAVYGLSQLEPLKHKLEEAKKRGFSMATVDVSAYDVLWQMERGESLETLGGNGKCPICMDTVGSDGHCVATPCAHLFCGACLDDWYQGAQVMYYGQQNVRRKCPICRADVDQKDCIEIVPPPPPSASDAAGSSSGAGPSSAAGPSSEAGPSSAGSDAPSYCAAFAAQAFRSMEPGDLPPLSLANARAIHQDAAAHLTAASGVPAFSAPKARSKPPMFSAKAAQLLQDLDALGEDAPGVPCKAVVFSAQPATITHLDVVLERGLRTGVSHASIRQGDTQQSLEEAVRRWKTSKGCAVLLLQASRAAAGLTLIAARHVFLMEPFLDRGQELQALNRCHRIGQQHAVSCVIYFSPRTIEERVLAYRTADGGGAPELPGSSGGGETDVRSRPEPTCP
jgi:hypothetical protein